MKRKYWVIGGEYTDTNFRNLAEGTSTQIYGPYHHFTAARAVWQRMADDTRSVCNYRFTIAEEYER